MTTLFLIILSTVLVSLLSLVGVFTLALKDKVLEKILSHLVSLAIGGMMGGAFLHLIPEAVEKSEGDLIFIYVLAGFFLFLIIEKVIHWRHCHQGHCSIHNFAYMSLFGDGIHNFIDGLIIATSFSENIGLGIASTLAIILHEIPQEIGDFGVLIYGGFKKNRALLFNFLSAVLAILGGTTGYFLVTFAENISVFLLPFAAGGFIYIAASDLIPEMRKENSVKKSYFNFIIIFIGILIMYFMKFLGVE